VIEVTVSKTAAQRTSGTPDRQKAWGNQAGCSGIAPHWYNIREQSTNFSPVQTEIACNILEWWLRDLALLTQENKNIVIIVQQTTNLALCFVHTKQLSIESCLTLSANTGQVTHYGVSSIPIEWSVRIVAYFHNCSDRLGFSISLRH
jgi:hypothetical protein